MFSRYLGLGFLSDFDLLPESRILKFLPRTFEVLPNKPRFDTPRTSFASDLRTNATAWKQRTLLPSGGQSPNYHGALRGLDFRGLFHGTAALSLQVKSFHVEYSMLSTASGLGLAAPSPDTLFCSLYRSCQSSCHLHRKTLWDPYV